MVALPQAPALGTKLWLCSLLADRKVPIRGIVPVFKEYLEPLPGYMIEGPDWGCYRRSRYHQ